MTQLITCIWYDHIAEEAANFYASLLPDCRITGINRFIFIAVEKEAPYGVCCYELDQQAIDLGNSIIDEQLRTYIECQELNSWPCYPSTTQTLSLPAWAARQSE